MGLLDGLGRGLSAAGYAAADMFSQQALQEQRAKLEEEKALRIADAMERRKVEPMQRFSGLIGTKMSEQVPLEAEPVTTSTSEGAKAAGYKDGLIGMTREQVAAYKDPDMLAQFDKQMGADKRLAEERVAGKTRPRTRDEAIKAALDEALMKDPQAYVAGQAMTSGDRKADIEERKLESREKTERARLEQRERSDERRFEAMMARLEKMGAKDGGNSTALIQNAEYLRSLKYSDDKIEKFIFQKKEIPLEDLAARILANDQFGEMTPQKAAQKAVALRDELDALRNEPNVATEGRKQGGAQKSAAPYPDGTRLRGKDGMVYVVKDGRPIPESEASRTSSGLIKQ